MKKLQFIVIQLIAFLIIFTAVASANNVSLDTSFNGTGYKIWSPVESPLRAMTGSMAVLPDGKKIIAGNVETGSNPVYLGFLVMRLNADETLDNSFGTNGLTITPIGRTTVTHKVLIQPDGKILLGGSSHGETTSYDYTVVRYNADGSLDATFNGVGYVTKSIYAHSYDELADMALQPDGKIVLVGYSAAIPWVGPTLDFNFGVMRLNTNGSFDTTFNGTGVLAIGNDRDKDEYGRAVIIDPGGKILIGGSHFADGSTRQSFRVIRLNPNGAIDSGFGIGGSVSTSVSGYYSSDLRTMALQSDGKIVAGGSGTGVVRYTADGVLDTTFGINGIAAVPLNIYSIRVIEGDKLLITERYSILRLLANGARDSNFQYNFTQLMGNTSCSPYSSYIDTDNKIIVGANCTTGGFVTNKPAIFHLKETRTKRFLSFYGSERTNYSLYRPSTGEWLYLPNGNARQFGAENDLPAPADFTGDGRADIAVFRPSTGEWLVLRSDNGTVLTRQFGLSGDIPVPADYDGDQINDTAVYRPSTGTWFIWKSTGGITYENFGLSTDKPVQSDFDGDFKTDIAIYRPSNGQWWIKRSSDGLIYAFEFGTASDKPVQGDYTGDGKTDAGFFRPSTGQWFVLRSEDSSYYGFPFGLSDDLPTPGDYGGDARFDAAVYRPSTNRWYVLTAERTVIQQDFGMPGDVPVPNFFVR